MFTVKERDAVGNAQHIIGMNADGHTEISEIKRREFCVCISAVKGCLVKDAVLVHIERGSPLGAGGQRIVI